jgi:hypothetical protein
VCVHVFELERCDYTSQLRSALGLHQRRSSFGAWHEGWGPKGLAFQRIGYLTAELKRPGVCLRFLAFFTFQLCAESFLLILNVRRCHGSGDTGRSGTDVWKPSSIVTFHFWEGQRHVRSSNREKLLKLTEAFIHHLLTGLVVVRIVDTDGPSMCL